MSADCFQVADHAILPATVVVRLCGVLDMTVAEPLFSAIGGRLQSGCRAVLVDARELEYINSTVLGLLAAAGDMAHQAGGTLALTGFSPDLARIVDRCGFPFLRRFPDVSSAEAHIRTHVL